MTPQIKFNGIRPKISKDAQIAVQQHCTVVELKHLKKKPTHLSMDQLNFRQTKASATDPWKELC